MSFNDVVSPTFTAAAQFANLLAAATGPVAPLDLTAVLPPFTETDYTGLAAETLGNFGTDDDGFDTMFDDAVSLEADGETALASFDVDLDDAAALAPAFEFTDAQDLTAQLAGISPGIDAALSDYQILVPPTPDSGTGGTSTTGGGTGTGTTPTAGPSFDIGPVAVGATGTINIKTNDLLAGGWSNNSTVQEINCGSDWPIDHVTQLTGDTAQWSAGGGALAGDYPCFSHVVYVNATPTAAGKITATFEVQLEGQNTPGSPTPAPITITVTATGTNDTTNARTPSAPAS